MTTIRVDVSALQAGRTRFSLPLQPEQALRTPLVLVPTGRVMYSEPVVGWSLRYFMQNPMYVVIGLMAVFAVAMPRMMESMDPEELKAMQARLPPLRALLSLSVLPSHRISPLLYRSKWGRGE